MSEIAGEARDPVARLTVLCDPGTLEPELHGAMIVATGRVAGRRIACYANDPALLGGSVGPVEAGALTRLLEQARRARLPVVAFVASAGARVHDGLLALDGFAQIFRCQIALRGVVPQISVVCGPSAGGGCYGPALSDIVVMTAEAAMFLTGPAIVAEALGERVTGDELGGQHVHRRNGVCDLVAADHREAASLARALMSYVAPVARLLPRAPEIDDPGAVLPAGPRQVYDVRDVIRGVVDGGSLLELSPRWAPNLIFALGRLCGRSVGVVASQPRRLGGVLDAAACAKAAHFVGLSDTLGLPLIVFVDTPGFMPGSKQEQTGIIRHGAELLRAFATATVPRVTVVLRKAYGGAYIAMNSRELGADAVFGWEGAELGVMGSHSAVGLIHARRLAAAEDPASARERLALGYAREQLTIERALSAGSIDEVVAPRATRARLTEALAARSPQSGRSRSVRADLASSHEALR